MSSQHEARLSINGRNAYISLNGESMKNLSDPNFNKNYLTAKPDRARSCSPVIQNKSNLSPSTSSVLQIPNKPLEIPVSTNSTSKGAVPKIQNDTSKSPAPTGMLRYISITKRNLSPQKGENSGKKQKTSDNTLSNNRYALLSEDVQDEPPQQIPSRPPPIYLREASSSDLVKTFVGLVGKNNFHLVPLRKGGIQETKIVIYSETHYRKIAQYLNDNKKNFYTYQLKSSKGLIVVIKGIESSVEPKEIKQALEELGYNVKNILNIFNKDKVPQPLFKIELEPNDKKQSPNEVHPIYSLRYLLHRRITIEQPHKRNGPVQCSNCQEFGHTKNYCQLRSVCVACGDLHSTSECKVIKNDLNRKCGNCGGDHPANYRGCPVYKTLLTRLREKQTASRSAKEPILNIASKPLDSEFPMLKNSSHRINSNGQVNIQEVPKISETQSYANILKTNKQPNTFQNMDGFQGLILTLTTLSQQMTNFMVSMQHNMEELLRAQNQMLQILLAKK